MLETFLKHALPAVLAFEGGYSDDPGDTGGATMYGITHTEYDAWRRASGEPTQDVRDISMAEAQNIYASSYWTPINGDALPFPIDWITFDAAVNMGVGTAIHMLEQAANEPEASGVSAELLAKIKADCATLAGTHELKEGELQERIQRYHAIADEHSNDVQFLHGWLNRVAELDAQS